MHHFFHCLNSQLWPISTIYLNFGEKYSKIIFEKCRDPGSNQGPLDLQSNALPTELSRLLRGKPPTKKHCWTYCNSWLKVTGLAVLKGLWNTGHSPALSHYWSARGLLAAGFPPWPGSPFLRQPGPVELLQPAHVEANLSADASSTWPNVSQESPSQAIHCNWPPSSWITRDCQTPRPGSWASTSKLHMSTKSFNKVMYVHFFCRTAMYTAIPCWKHQFSYRSLKLSNIGPR